MKDMNEPYDDWRKRLRAYKEKPDIRLWNSIMVRFEEENRPKRLQKKIRSGWLFLMGILIISGLYLWVDHSWVTYSTIGLPAEQKLSKQAKVSPKIAAPALPKHIAGATSVKIPSIDVIDSIRPTPASTIPAKTVVELTFRRNDLQNIHQGSTETAFEGLIERDHSYVTNEEVDSLNNKAPIANNEITNTTENKPEEKEHRSKNGRRLNVYFTVMPTLGYQRIESNNNDNLIIESIDRIKTFSTDRLGVRAELGAEFPLNNRVNIFGGLLYFQRKQSIGYTEKQVSETEIITGPNGEILVNPKFAYVHRSFEFEVRNLGLQVGLNYQLSRRKFLQTVGTGLEFHVALNKFRDDRLTSEFTNNPSVYVFYNLYYRLQYPADTKLKAIFQPTLNYSFYINDNVNAPFYVKPYGLGLNLGFTYNF